MLLARLLVRCCPKGERVASAASNKAKAREATNHFSHWLETLWGIRIVRLAGIDRPSRCWILCRSQVRSSPTKKKVWGEPQPTWGICRASLKFPEEREPSQSTRKKMVSLILTTRPRLVSSTWKQSSAHTTQTGLLEPQLWMPSLIPTSLLDMKSFSHWRILATKICTRETRRCMTRRLGWSMTTLVSQWSRLIKKEAYLISSWTRACTVPFHPSSKSQVASKSWANPLVARKSSSRLPTASLRRQPTQHRKLGPLPRTWLTLTRLSRPRAWCSANFTWWSLCSATRSKPTTLWSKRLAPLGRSSTQMLLQFACSTSDHLKEKLSVDSEDEDRSRHLPTLIRIVLPRTIILLLIISTQRYT